MTSGLETEWDYSGRKGRDGQKKKISEANERKRKKLRCVHRDRCFGYHNICDTTTSKIHLILHQILPVYCILHNSTKFCFGSDISAVHDSKRKLRISHQTTTNQVLIKDSQQQEVELKGSKVNVKKTDEFYIVLITPFI